MELINPPPLKKEDTIAIVAPSGGLAKLYPHRLDNAIKYFKSQGYNIKEFPNTRKNNGWESASPKERAKELMEAFLDKEVKAIICEIGGNTSNKILKYLDFNKIKENPKIFSGYSDISVLHYAINKKSNLLTFYGPCAMVQFGEYPKPLDFTIEYFNKAITEKNIGKIEPSKEWTDEVLDWRKKKDLDRPRKLIKNKGYEWLKNGEAKGKVLGGCLPSITHLIGTVYWPDHKDAILFIELSEGVDIYKGKPLAEIDALLADLDNAKIFSQIKGLIVGRPYRYSKDEEDKFKQIILDNTQDYNFPILYGVDIGHTDPQITVPLGINAELNSKRNLFKLDF